MKYKTVILMMLTASFLAIPPVRAASVEETECLASSKHSSEKERQQGQEGSFRHAFDMADCLRKAAATQRAEWLETEKLLQRSLELADTGEWEKALQLVQKAHFQAVTAIQQAEHEAEAWKGRVVK